MAFDKSKFRKELATRFASIKESDKATEKVAEAIADAVEGALAEIDVEVRLQASATLDAVPGKIDIDETAKGKLK